jgi:hypothetical protein
MAAEAAPNPGRIKDRTKSLLTLIGLLMEGDFANDPVVSEIDFITMSAPRPE